MSVTYAKVVRFNCIYILLLTVISQVLCNYLVLRFWKLLRFCSVVTALAFLYGLFLTDLFRIQYNFADKVPKIQIFLVSSAESWCGCFLSNGQWPMFISILSGESVTLSCPSIPFISCFHICSVNAAIWDPKAQWDQSYLAICVCCPHLVHTSCVQMCFWKADMTQISFFTERHTGEEKGTCICHLSFLWLQGALVLQRNTLK